MMVKQPGVTNTQRIVHNEKRYNISQAITSVHNRTHDPEKITTRSSNGNQIAGLIFLLIELITSTGGGWMIVSWITDTHHFPLTQLVVTGYYHYTTNDDIRQAIVALGVTPKNFMTQKVDIIQQQIERIPWIKQARVRKQWPDKLKIYLVEYVPIAHWNNQYLLDNSGKVFSVPAERINNKIMPMLYGHDSNVLDVLNGYHAINTVLMTSKFHLQSISVNARHSWQLTLRDNIRLELGRYDIVRRLQRFIGIYPVLLQRAKKNNKRISYVDLRYDSGLAVSWTTAHTAPENSN